MNLFTCFGFITINVVSYKTFLEKNINVINITYLLFIKLFKATDINLLLFFCPFICNVHLQNSKYINSLLKSFRR